MDIVIWGILVFKNDFLSLPWQLQKNIVVVARNVGVVANVVVCVFCVLCNKKMDVYWIDCDWGGWETIILLFMSNLWDIVVAMNLPIWQWICQVGKESS